MTVRIHTWQLLAALVLSALSFISGFAVSRYVIDLELQQAHTAVLRSAEDLNRYENTMAQQFAIAYQAVERRMNAVRADRSKSPNAR